MLVFQNFARLPYGQYLPEEKPIRIGKAAANIELMQAIASGDEQAVRSALKNKGADIEHIDSTGLTPLGVAANYKKLQIAVLLLEMGANPNPPFARSTPLQLAAMNNDWDMALLLLDRGADPEFESTPRASAIALDPKIVKTEVAEALRQMVFDRHWLREPGRFGWMKQELIGEGADRLKAVQEGVKYLHGHHQPKKEKKFTPPERMESMHDAKTKKFSADCDELSFYLANLMNVGLGVSLQEMEIVELRGRIRDEGGGYREWKHGALLWHSAGKTYLVDSMEGAAAPLAQQRGESVEAAIGRQYEQSWSRNAGERPKEVKTIRHDVRDFLLQQIRPGEDSK